MAPAFDASKLAKVSALSPSHLVISASSDPSAFMSVSALSKRAFSSVSDFRIPMPSPSARTRLSCPVIQDSSPFDAVTSGAANSRSASTASASPLRTAATASSKVPNSSRSAPDAATWEDWTVPVWAATTPSMGASAVRPT